MSYTNASGRSEFVPPDRAVQMPSTRTGLLVAAGACLLVPVVALMWVSSYAKETPRLGGIPFFFWYQFAWVFVTSALTYTAHRLVLAARGRQAAEARPGGPVGDDVDPGSRS